MLAGMSNASVSTISLIVALSEIWFSNLVFALSPESDGQASRLLTPH